MTDIARDDDVAARQGNAPDKQIRPADLLELLVPPELDKLGGSGGIERDDGDTGEQFLALVKQLLGVQELFSVTRRQEKTVSSAKDLDLTNDCCCHVLFARAA